MLFRSVPQGSVLDRLMSLFEFIYEENTVGHFFSEA